MTRGSLAGTLNQCQTGARCQYRCNTSTTSDRRGTLCAWGIRRHWRARPVNALDSVV
ncbi:hypothetical protein J7Z05_000760 [Salmonella enterica]|nr:hypothetical protein [Salmonella enterica]